MPDWAPGTSSPIPPRLCARIDGACLQFVRARTLGRIEGDRQMAVSTNLSAARVPGTDIAILSNAVGETYCDGSR
jgi:hypothetical protein